MTDREQPTTSVVIERNLAAPVDLVWKMWTDAEHFKAWYGPRGATIPVAEFDVRVGGRRFVGMDAHTPNGPMQMWFTGEHLIVAEPDRLAYSESIADENGNVKSPASIGMPEGHPITTEVHLEFVVDENGTKMTLTHVGIPTGSPGEMGWNMAFDKLSAYVAAHTNG